MPNHPVVADDFDALSQAQIGSTFVRSVVGWDVKWVDGGTTIFVQGPTITEALAGHGLQITHPVPGERPPAPVTVSEPAVNPNERRAPHQDGAIEVAFAEGVLPEADRRHAEAKAAEDAALDAAEADARAADEETAKKHRKKGKHE